MWILTPLTPGGETQYLLASKEFVVGRKNCDILLTNDQSISRAHANLTLTDQTLILKDTSKYGTFVNGKRVTENTNLKSGDSVTFGAFNSKFSVDHQKLVVCSSCLDNEGKASLSQDLLALGGKLVNTWTQDCTHLVMPTVRVTIKTISAVLCCCPIVKPQFFLEFNKAVQQKVAPPKAESFIPEIDEPCLIKEDVNLGVIPARKQLFTEKTFVFLSAKQLKRLSGALSFGKAKCRLLEEGALPRDLLESPQTCVVDVTTGSSQTLLSSATTEWANSVKNIVERKGLRVITESEIGLAAIFASCDKHCNPSSLQPDSDSAAKAKARIPSASLSQSVAVAETVLLAASQNVTAYAVNTEPLERSAPFNVTGVTAVGETPEKKHGRSKVLTPSVVADTMSSSYVTNSQRKTTESKLTDVGTSGTRPKTSTSWSNAGMKTFPQKLSPQKVKSQTHVSPQKQSTLTSFFQPSNKKRPLDDDFSDVMSEPKRPVHASSINRMPEPNASVAPKETPSCSHRLPTATSQTPRGTGAELFARGKEDRACHSAQEEPQSRKRKEMEAEIQMEELESIMSEEMDFLDEPPSGQKGQHGQPKWQSSTGQKQDCKMEEAPTASKRQRILAEDSELHTKPVENKSESHGNQSKQSQDFKVSIKMENVDPSENTRTNHKSVQSKTIQPSEHQDFDLLQADDYEPNKESKMLLKALVIKQEVQETKVDEDLPKNLVLVEFRSLTVSAPLKIKPKQMLSKSCAKNFKCFRKRGVPGVNSSPHIIGGSDLLVHSRGKNSDLDEWLKDAAEEERQSRRDETVGDDLFRYNPTKLTKRR